MRASFVLLLVVSTALARLASAAPLTADAPVLEPARRADAVVITYREIQGEIGGADRGPTLAIYGDGRMVTHYPPYMRRAGEYEQRLRPGELDALVRSLANKGVLEFDGTAARTATRTGDVAARQRALAERAPFTLFEAADASTTVIEVTLERYRPSSGAPERRNVMRRAAWTNLRMDAARHADVPAVRDLAAAELELRALRERPGFARIR